MILPYQQAKEGIRRGLAMPVGKQQRKGGLKEEGQKVC
jgi:hypothetical protein